VSPGAQPGIVSMMELFESSGEELLPVPGADLSLWSQIDFGDEQEILDELIATTPWKSEQITVWGKTYPQPRLVAWYGDNAQRYSYSGVTHEALPMTATLHRLRGKVEALVGVSFNSVLLNYYRDNRDGMGFHADDEPELGPCPVIASVSFGETRQFVMKHRANKDVKDVKLPLPSGSLLLMRGATQANWKHGIPKTATKCGPRVNLTFRRIR
jgi:alkylated DNA repair dioxygenase AlkB